MEAHPNLPGMEAEADRRDKSGQTLWREAPRLRRPDRAQALLRPCVLEELLPADHPARTVWAVACRLDLSAFHEPIDARGSNPGRASTDPRLLVALWLYAAVEGVGNGRKLARLCEAHDAYRWICGGVSVNYHTLNDFRVGHEAALDELFTRALATLMHKGLVKINRISQDGTKVRAGAGGGSYRRRGRLEKLLEEAREHVAAIKTQGDDAPGSAGVSAQRRAAQERAARERLSRVEAALAEMNKLEEVKDKQRDDKPSKHRAPRASTTDPEARRMKMADGGYRPAYNIQIATDPSSRAIVGIGVTNHGTDHGEDQPLREQVERDTGAKVSEQLLDGGYVKRGSIEAAAGSGVSVFAPPPATGVNGSVCIHNPRDTPAVAAWRARMQTPQGRGAYKERAATSETVNADLKTFRGLGSLAVRGLKKVRCVALWSALAYNLLHFGAALAA